MAIKGKFLKSIIEISHVEFQSYDFQNRHLICTSGLAMKILGYTEGEYVELSRNFYEELIHPDDLQKVHLNISYLANSAPGDIIEMTARYKKSDGNYIWIYTRKMVTERDQKGNPSVLTTVAEDITGLVELEMQLKEKTRQLELISYKNSHELRSPVAAIIGLLNIVEEHHITSEHNLQVFSFLKQAIEKLDRVIHEINDATG